MTIYNDVLNGSSINFYSILDNVIDSIIINKVFIITMLIILLFILLILAFNSITEWIIFKKAGRSGIESIIPIYNTIIKYKFLDIPIWMIILTFIPACHLALKIITNINLAKKFNKDIAFAIGLILLEPLFKAIIAFDGSIYNNEKVGIFKEDI